MTTDEDWLSRYQPQDSERQRFPYAPPTYPVHGAPPQAPLTQSPENSPGWVTPAGQPHAAPIGGAGAVAFGLVSWVPLFGFLGIVAILLGISALKRAAIQGQAAPSVPLAGIITGSMGLGATALMVIALLAVD